MKQLCIRLDENTFNKIRNRADNKALKLSEYIRRLIELGLRIEEMSEQKSTNKSQDDEQFADLGSSKILWEKELSWMLEMRFLMRFLVEKVIYGKEDIAGNLLNESKIRAENFVSGMLNNKVIEN